MKLKFKEYTFSQYLLILSSYSLSSYIYVPQTAFNIVFCKVAPQYINTFHGSLHRASQSHHCHCLWRQYSYHINHSSSTKITSILSTNHVLIDSNFCRHILLKCPYMVIYTWINYVDLRPLNVLSPFWIRVGFLQTKSAYCRWWPFWMAYLFILFGLEW